jgi:hypothetical protein
LAVRCAWLTDGARLSGFTLRNGATRSQGTGGGVLCVSTNGIVSNCLLTNNSAFYGGGAGYGTLNNCLISFNIAANSGGGSYYAILNNCTVSKITSTLLFPLIVELECTRNRRETASS